MVLTVCQTLYIRQFIQLSQECYKVGAISVPSLHIYSMPFYCVLTYSTPLHGQGLAVWPRLALSSLLSVSGSQMLGLQAVCPTPAACPCLKWTKTHTFCSFFIFTQELLKVTLATVELEDLYNFRRFQNIHKKLRKFPLYHLSKYDSKTCNGLAKWFSVIGV